MGVKDENPVQTAKEIAPLLRKADKEVYQTKVIIRRLPPDLTEEKFLQRLSPLPEHDYYYFCTADLTLGAHAFCRAYFNFRKFEGVLDFRRRCDGLVFEDARGRKYPAVVEFAPLQKIPRAREKMKKDPKCGTIEQDKDYKSFLASLEAQLPSFPTAEQRLEEIEMKEKELANKTTPLVEYLLRKKRQGGSRVDGYKAARDKKKRKDEMPPAKAGVKKGSYGKGKYRDEKSSFEKKGAKYYDDRKKATKFGGGGKGAEYNNHPDRKSKSSSSSAASLTSETLKANEEREWPSLSRDPSDGKPMKSQSQVSVTPAKEQGQPMPERAQGYGKERRKMGRPDVAVYVPRPARKGDTSASQDDARPSSGRPRSSRQGQYKRYGSDY
ncbi:regulator of nonsense transcripts 3B-like isoform X2 [Oscarella lobularis]|uniref:regulator of nonsense transcripts 3B-like isoform X2 n=1 Tax=Oscarella lobularis TaxID=121494 RepID=UPI00331408BC